MTRRMRAVDVSSTSSILPILMACLIILRPETVSVVSSLVSQSHAGRALFVRPSGRDNKIPYLLQEKAPHPACRWAGSKNKQLLFAVWRHHSRSCIVTAPTVLYTSSSSQSKESDEFVEAEDLEALQALFSKYCDKDGLMTMDVVRKLPAIAELMEEGDLLPEEFTDIWNRAPKFPDEVETNDERIDVDSFVQVYRDIDDLFEDEGDEEEDRKDSTTTPTIANTKKSTSKPTGTNNAALKEAANGPIDVSGQDETSVENDDTGKDPALEAELGSIFETLCDKASGLLSKTELRKWDEIQKLAEEGLLGEDEFDDLWTKTSKSPGSEDQINMQGFLSFNMDLDSLFDFEDDEMEEDDIVVPSSAYTVNEEEIDASSEPTESKAALRMIRGDDLPPDVLFVSLANKDGLVGRDELKRWAELQEMLEEGDLLESELDGIYNSVKKSEMDLNKLKEDGFVALFKAIEDLFEDDVEGGNEDGSSTDTTQQSSAKGELLGAIASLSGEDLLPCGLEALEMEQKEILSIASDVEKEATNLVRLRQGAIVPEDLNGEWELLYSSSSAMKFNKGLSGLGGSFPNGQFGGLLQKLTANKFLADVEYIEHIEVNPSNASFDVKVTGTWDLRTSVSLFTGEPSIVMTVEPDRVTYGPTSTRADHWKSLGPMNMLDITYLDDDLRIMRGNTAIDTIFVFRRKV